LPAGTSKLTPLRIGALGIVGEMDVLEAHRAIGRTTSGAAPGAS
jgi:hypothetical protein